MIKYYKSHVYSSLIGGRACCTDYYKIDCRGNLLYDYIRFRVSLHKTHGMESSSLDDLSNKKQTWAYSSIRYFRKLQSAVPCSEAEYKKNFYKMKKKLIAKARKLKP